MRLYVGPTLRNGAGWIIGGEESAKNRQKILGDSKAKAEAEIR